MNFGSLFSGIGGIDLGLERAGMTCRWQVEINPFCQKVLKKHWPNVKRYPDVRNVGKHNLETVELIAGGFPCRPHSLAGKRRGAADDRDLWPEYRRIIAELKPTWVLGENVPGIKTTILDDILSDLELMDYEARTFVIPAAALGAPHIRERIFIVANAQSERCEKIREHCERCQEWIAGSGQVLANAPEQHGQINRQETLESRRCCTNLCYPIYRNIPHREYLQVGESPERIEVAKSTRSNWWAAEPGVGRVAHGIPGRVDRLKALGNAVVPQVAEWIGRLILEVE